MSAPSEDRPARADAHTPATGKILVWDAPVRVFHWLMVLSFAGAYLTAESERWQLVHLTLGYTMAGLVLFRILWGVVGTRHARFGAFVRGPAVIAHYLRTLVRGRPEHYTGHNPAGAVAILALLILTMLAALSGWATYRDPDAEWMEELHEAAANVMLAVVAVHVAGVLIASWLHRENLIGSMITGRKIGASKDALRSAWLSVAEIMLAAVLGYWWLQWQGAPAEGEAGDQHVSATVSRERAKEAPGLRE